MSRLNRLYRRPESPGVAAALIAALLFGAGTPLAKMLLADGLSPWLLAGLLYLGSGRRHGAVSAGDWSCSGGASDPEREWPWLAGAILSGGVLAPVLLMVGLTGMPATGASLLLNAEGVFTALLAWFAFRENFDRRIALGMAVHPGWCADPELATAGELCRCDAGACHPRGLSGLGHRQQPDPQGVVDGRHLDRRGKRTGRRHRQSGARIFTRGSATND